MKMTIESTGKIVTLNSIAARIWEGKTERGVKVICFITRIAVDEDQPESVYEQFNMDLAQCRRPSVAAGHFPTRMSL